MPLLDRTGEIEDAFDGRNGAYRLVDLETLPSALDEASEATGYLGLRIANTARAQGLKPFFNRLSLIAIAFPSFSDGRGFSIARQLRNLGYRGRLRAVGPLIPDTFAYALSCGFDEVELPPESLARAPIGQWRAALGAISHGYQRGRGDAANILDQRRAARKASHAA